MFATRIERVRSAMAAQGIDVVLLSVGADLPYLTGYEAMPLERLTMLVLPADDTPRLVIPRLEAPRVAERDEFAVVPWGETEDPVAIVADLVGRRRRAAIGDQTWSRFVLALQDALPATPFVDASRVLSPIRAVKDAHEVDCLRRAGAAVDRIAERLRGGEIPLVGRTEAQVAADLAQQILDEGHHRVNFTIVASGPNAASPHHDAGSRVIGEGEVVLCDFGGTMADEHGVGYCSDITRCVHTGPPPAEFAELYEVLHTAQAAAVAAARVGRSCEEVDAAARSIITAAGYGEEFVHRTGHGIGVEAHEDPYIVAGNATPLVAGHAFSIEPGIYVPDRWGARLEDIVVATEAEADPMNRAGHHLAIL